MTSSSKSRREIPGVGIKLQGWVTPSVLDHEGRTVWQGEKQRNLILDQGLDQIAQTHIADIFGYAVKGTGVAGTPTPTVEVVSGTYTQAASTTTVTRASGARNFTSADIGKLIKFTAFTGKPEAKILSITSTTQVEVDRQQSGAITGQVISLYSVQQVGLDSETGMRNLAGTVSKTLGSGAVSASNSSQFTSADVGRMLYIPSLGVEYPITAFTDGQHVTVNFSVNDMALVAVAAIVYIPRASDPTQNFGRTNTYSAVSGENSTTDGTGGTLGQRTMLRTFIFDAELPNAQVITGSFTLSGGTLTGSGMSTPFTAQMVGDVVGFADGTEYGISAYISATQVTVSPGSGGPSTNITLYGFTAYNEVGFSHTGSPGNNLNIRVVLASAANVQAPTGQFPGQQLKLQYELEVSLTPNASTASNPTVNDTGNQMSGSKAGNACCEALALSAIAADGSTDSTLVGLEPSEMGTMAISPSSAALVPMGGPDRSSNVATEDLAPATYATGSFSNSYVGTFGINEAVGTSWRTLMVWDPNQNLALFTHLFTQSQHKDALHTLTVTFGNSWSRNLGS